MLYAWPLCVPWHFSRALQRAPLRAAVHLLLTLQPTSISTRVPGRAPDPVQRLCNCSCLRPAAWRLLQDSLVPNAPGHAELLRAGQQVAPSAGPLAMQLASTSYLWQLCECIRGIGSGHTAGAELHITCGNTDASDAATCRPASC